MAGKTRTTLSGRKFSERMGISPLLFVLLAPLFFGAVHVWSYTLLFLVILTLAFVLTLNNITREKGKNHEAFFLIFPKTPLALLFMLMSAFLLLQMTPLPEFLLGAISPTSLKIWREAISAGTSSPIISDVGWRTVAPYIYPVRMSLVRWIVYGMLFLAITQTLNSRKKIETAVILLLVVCCFESLYGIMETYSGHNKIWWYKLTKGPKDVRGTYINRNHFAGLMEMGIVLAITYAAALSGKRTGKSSPARKSGFKDILLSFFSSEGHYTKRFLVIFSGVIMALGLILSASRGGIIAAVFAVFILGIFLSRRRDQKHKSIIVVVLCVLTIAYALVIGIDYTLGRFELFDRAYEDRAALTDSTMQMFDDYKLMGIGVGDFTYALGKYQTERHRKIAPEYGHNDWAQLLAEGGVVGVAIVIIGMALYLIATLKRWLAQSDPFAIGLGLAPIGALGALAVHSYSDFNLHIPANFMILVAIVAIGHNALYLEGRNGRKDIKTPHYHLALKGAGAIVLFVMMIMIFWSGMWCIRHFVSEAYCHTETNATLNLDTDPLPESIRRAIAWDGENAAYDYKLARYYTDKRNGAAPIHGPGTQKWEEYGGLIMPALRSAIFKNPLNAEYYVRFGFEYYYQWNKPDYGTNVLPMADLYMEQGSDVAGNSAENTRLFVDMGNYWLLRAETLGIGTKASEEAWEMALWHYYKALKLDNGDTIREEIARNVRDVYHNEDRVREALLVE
ncbi:MAG: O-antigen ligase family protein [Smithellaceae bacterium]|nr:O-antigen ligase family protein [Smithellaceae bacterium]